MSCTIQVATSPTPVRKAWRSLTWLGVDHRRPRRRSTRPACSGAADRGPRSSRSTSRAARRSSSQPKSRAARRSRRSSSTRPSSIIRQRVDASGVAEAEINTAGHSNIVVAIPGEPDDADARPHRVVGEARVPRRCSSPARRRRDQSVDPTGDPDAAPTPTPTPTLESTPTRRARPTAATRPGSRPALQAEYDTFDCVDARRRRRERRARRRAARHLRRQPARVKYLLGPVEVERRRHRRRHATAWSPRRPGASTGQWAVNIDFNERGHRAVRRRSATRLVRPDGQTPRNQFAIVLDGTGHHRPDDERRDHRRQARRSPATSRRSRAKTLADQLKFGALPISFTVQSSDTISRDPRHRRSCRAASSPASSASSSS